jgi:opacity protein-like surface antigen
MKRLAQVMCGFVAATLWSAGAARAQTPPQPWAAQVDAAATFGHASSGSVGAEVDRRLTGTWDLTFEVGHMNNITSSATEDRANIIGSQIAATANPAQSAIYYDFGVRYHLMPDGKWNPYVTVGFGAARVKTETTFSQNGAVLSSDQLAADLVALGADLDGTILKPLVVFGVGVDVPVRGRVFVDGSYRYGHIFPRTSEIDNDKANNTQRLQVGVGIKF